MLPVPGMRPAKSSVEVMVLDVLQIWIDRILHLDKYLEKVSVGLGHWNYVILFAVVFCETGLIVTPFLPGDSLLFAVGALVARPEMQLSMPLMFITLLTAAILGDAVNYSIGRQIGPRVFRSESSRLLNRKHLDKAQHFYERYGGKAIFLARFVPIVRTFAPFVAGIGKMNYFRFWAFNVSGAICWVGGFLTAGYLFGSWPLIKDNFSLVTLGIIVVSVLPIVFEWYRARRECDAAEKPAESPENSAAHSSS